MHLIPNYQAAKRDIGVAQMRGPDWNGRRLGLG
jgi:hypothetical protein